MYAWVCVCTRTRACVCGCMGGRGVLVCVHGGERGTEREEGGSPRVGGCALRFVKTSFFMYL